MPAAPPVPPITQPPVTAPPGAVPPPPVPPGPVPVLPVTSEHRTGNDACIKRLKQLEIEPEEKVYPPTTAPSRLGTELTVQTNVFGIELGKQCNVIQYGVSIKADLTPTKEVVFTKKGKEDFIVTDRHAKCCAVLLHAMQKYGDFFDPSNNCVIYDGQSTMFTTIDLFPGVVKKESKIKLFDISGPETGHPDLQRMPSIKLEIFATKNQHVKFSQEDIGRRTADVNIESVNRAYEQILELALNQHCVRDTSKCVVFEHGKVFFVKPLEEGFDVSDITDVGDGKSMLPGLKKKVQFIEGPYGRGSNNPSVVIDGMKVAFHKEQPVIEKIGEMCPRDFQNGLKDNDRERCVAVIKGLDCYSKYMGREQHLKIEGIHHQGARTSRFELPEHGTCSVEEYFRDKYKITLQYPNANLLICKFRGNLNFYPIELMTITKNQRVSISQQTSQQSQRTTRESAVLPAVRQRLIMTGKMAAKICSANETLSRLGISVCENPLVVNARQLPLANLATSDRQSNFPTKENKWRIGQYTRPADPPAVWALYVVGTHNTKFDNESLQKFGEQFVGMCKSKGIVLPAVADSARILFETAEEKLRLAAKAGCKFAFMITDDTITSVHQKYKAIERETEMIVQDMKLSKALSVIQGKMLTLENVINKTNVKLGGTNYIVRNLDKYLDGHLIIGVGISNTPASAKHVKGQLNPLIIGFSSNGNQSQEFVGDFVLSQSGQDTMSPIEDIVTQALHSYKQRKGDYPQEVVVYRSGACEGNHGSIIAFEIPLARAAMKRCSPKMKLLYLAVSKDHTFRFFRNDSGSSGSNSTVSHSSSRGSMGSQSAKAWELNVGPGLVVDSEVTHPACKQFFLNSHSTLQGTAKTPLYTVLADDGGYDLGKLEEITYNLCHHHQIVGLATSLPTPLYVANEYAKRGRNLWNEANAKEAILRGTGSERARMQEVTEQISYKKTRILSNRRVNA